MSSCNDPCADSISIIVDTGSRGDVGPPGPPSAVVEWTFYPSVGDTIISGDDASAKSLAYQEDSVQVFLNGVMLSKKDDYTTAADGLAIVLNEAIVNAGDIVNILSQMPPSDFDPTNDHNRLQGQIDDNKTSIEGLDVRVTANEEAIEGLTGLAGGFTTRDVKVSGVNTSRAVADDVTLENQQDINLYFDESLGTIEGRLDSVEGGQPDLSSDIAELRTDVDENTQGISDNAQALNDIVDVVEANATDIDGLQDQINKLPPPTDISDLEKDVDGIAQSVATNTIAISKNTTDIANLGAPVDLDPLNDAIAINAAGISTNAADIAKLQTTDAKHSSQISDLETSVGHLEAIDIPDNYAVVDEDNSFETSQTIKSGINITGAEAFIKADTGTAVTFSNNNAFNPVIEIQRSNGDVSLALHADGHIRGVKTDENDDTSAVSVGYFEANVGAGGGDSDLSKFATKIELADEELARKLADEQLQKNIDALEAFDETKLTNRIAQEEAARAAGDASLDGKIKTEAQYREDGDDALQAQLDAIDPSLYATVLTVEAGDAATLAAANKYTDESIAAIDFPDGVDLDGYATEEFVTNAIDAIEFPSGTVVSDTAPVDPEEGANWFSTVRLELFVFAEGAWMPCSPFAAADAELQAEIDELALALNAILVNRDSGQWQYKGPLSAGPPREPGELSILEDMSDTDNYITMHAEDLNGKTHTHTDLEVGDYMELVNVDNPQQYLLYVVTQTLLAAVNMLEVHVSMKRKSGDDFAIGAKLEVRYYALSGQDIAMEDLDDRFINVTGDTMTGTLEVPRFDVKKTDDEAICLIEGKIDGTGSSARLTFSNKINPNAYGNLEWHGNNGNGWFQFNKDVDFSSKNLHSVNHVRLAGERTIQEGTTNRIKLDGKVIIPKTGDSNVDGFVIKGKTEEGNDSNLLSVYHNQSGLDAVNYRGKQGSSSNVATCGYVDSAVRNVGTPLPQFRLYTGDFIDDWNPGDMAFCDVSGDTTTTLSAVRSVLFHAEDINGKRWSRDKNSTGYRRNYSSSLSVLLPGGEQTIFSMSPSHNILCELYHITDFEDYQYDMYVISWTGLTSACLTSSMESVTDGDTYLLHVPEIFF